MKDELEKFSKQFVQKLDLSEPGIFIFKLKENIPNQVYESINDTLGAMLHEYSPESTILILPPYFEQIEVVDERIMNEKGWYKK